MTSFMIFKTLAFKLVIKDNFLILKKFIYYKPTGNIIPGAESRMLSL